jgi:hypothetical protein
MTGERGFTLVELCVTIAIGMTVVLATFALVDVVTHNSARVAARVHANQAARPVLQRLLDDLHSTCLGPNVAPVLAGSTSSSASFLHQTGSSVSPIPEKQVVALTGTTLTETIYPSNGGVAPNWTFSATPSSIRQMLTRVGPGAVGTPPATVPLFRYYADQSGQIAATPLPTPLSAADAARADQVSVAFSFTPPTVSPKADPSAAISISDSTYLRFSPFSEDITKVNGPCA